MSSATDPPITETITSSNSDSDSDNSEEPMTETIESNEEIVETLYDTDGELIGYSCKQILENNTAEPMDLMFYMDVLTPKGYQRNGNGTNDNSTSTTTTTTTTSTPQETAIVVAQKILLREMAREYGIDPDVSRGVRCFDLPVDGSTWIVRMTIEPRDFKEVTLFGGCRQLEWDPETHDCKFYEARMKGAYLGAVARGEDGTPFGDTIGELEELIDGPMLADEIRFRWEGSSGSGESGSSGVIVIDSEPTKPPVAGSGSAAAAAADDYDTAFLGVPRVTDDPNFQGGDQGKDVLNEPTNIKTGIDASQSQINKNRTQITLVGGLLVALFSVVLCLTAYVLIKRRRSYRKNHGLPPVAAVCNNVDAELPYEDLQKQDTDGGEEDFVIADAVHGDDGDDYVADPRQHQRRHQPNIDDPDNRQRRPPLGDQYSDEDPMNDEAIQIDLGNNLRGRLMGVHGSSEEHPPPGSRPYNGSILLSPDRSAEETDLDETDSWAQADGTIGSLELQLEPITAEV